MGLIKDINTIIRHIFRDLPQILFVVLYVSGPFVASSQSLDILNSIALDDMTPFQNSPENWHTVANIWYGLDNGKIKSEEGRGILINEPSENNNQPLITNMDHKSIALSFDFMLAPGASSAIYLQGRYGIFLNDSWEASGRIAADACGSILRPGEGGDARAIPPRMNVVRAPGLWQHIDIVFQAPRFNAAGRKTADARFSQIVLNGTVIHEDIALSGISYRELFDAEQPTGPLAFSGRGSIALRNLQYATFDNNGIEPEQLLSSGRGSPNTAPLILTPRQKSLVQRCFMAGENKKRTFCVAVGEPGAIHYAIDLAQGAMINIWKGKFIDVTTMWHSRGEIQLAQPLGSVIALSPGPVLATLSGRDAAWPDSMQQNYQFKAYRLDAEGRPTFIYSFGGAEITDQILPDEKNRYLTRSLRISNGEPGGELWFRLAEGFCIEELDKGLYAVDDKSYYIRLNGRKRQRLMIRNVNGREELLVRGSDLAEEETLTWSLIW